MVNGVVVMIKPPVIAIDGPAASGKGTVARLLAHHLNFHYLDSGKLYRSIAWLSLQQSTAVVEEDLLVLVEHFIGGECSIDDAALASEAVGIEASRIAVIPALRQRLTSIQHLSRRSPGLVADGRDMSSVVFPDAILKIYLTADVKKRAVRRYEQLRAQGINAKISNIRADLEKRDKRDAERAVAPLEFSDDYILVDSTKCSAHEVMRELITAFEKAYKEKE